jgi:hypothetical protein
MCNERQDEAKERSTRLTINALSARRSGLNQLVSFVFRAGKSLPPSLPRTTVGLKAAAVSFAEILARNINRCCVSQSLLSLESRTSRWRREKSVPAESETAEKENY